MKDFVRFGSAEETDAFLRALWRTDAFRASHDDEGGYVRALARAACARPLFFHRMTTPDVEWSHFTTWLGTVALRDYDNAALHDLYYLHELVHFATLSYDGDVSFAQWHGKMCRNEMLASTHSEAYVHLVLPGLRDAFAFEIWVDRFLPGGERAGEPAGYAPHASLAALAADDGEPTLLGFLYDERHQAMMLPDPFDFTEMQIAKYGKQNFGWSQVWQRSFRDVERRVSALHAHAREDRAAAVEAHVAWLDGLAAASDGVPYLAEATVFRDAVRASDAQWGNDLLKG